MIVKRSLVAFSLAALCAAPMANAGTALAAQPPGAPPMPKPGPEHQVLKEDEGEWDALVQIFTAPGAPPMESKGVETNRIGCGGLCLITDFKSEMMGQAFEGHGTTAWNPDKKKYVGSWSDSMSLGLAFERVDVGSGDEDRDRLDGRPRRDRQGDADEDRRRVQGRHARLHHVHDGPRRQGRPDDEDHLHAEEVSRARRTAAPASSSRCSAGLATDGHRLTQA